MGLLSHSKHDLVMKITSLPRWQRDWLNNHKNINYSGLVDDMLNRVIEKNDPIYFAKNFKIRTIRRQEETDKAKC